MFSVNVPIPGEVERVATDLLSSLQHLDSIRERHTLVLKRLSGVDLPQKQIAFEVRQALAGAEPFEARLAGIGTFEEPATGPGPVVYLAVESPGLHKLHGRLVEAFGAVDGIEGGDYVPHITLGRGGPADAVTSIRSREIDPTTWTVTRLHLWDASRGATVEHFCLRT